MRINIKPKIEATDQYNLRMPVTLKKRLETQKTRAENLGADFNATLVGMIEEFATEPEARFDAQDQSVSTSFSSNPRTNPNKVLGRPASATVLSPTAADSVSTPGPVTANGGQPERSSKREASASCEMAWSRRRDFRNHTLLIPLGMTRFRIRSGSMLRTISAAITRS